MVRVGCGERCVCDRDTWERLGVVWDWVGISGVALSGYIHSSPYTIPTPDTHSQYPTPPLTQPIYQTTAIHHSPNPHTSCPYLPIPPQSLSPVPTRRTCHYRGFGALRLLNTNVKHRMSINNYRIVMNKH